MRYAMIMAGGAGTRLWPMSRRHRPKQLLPLVHGQSLLEVAWNRLDHLIDPPQRLICTSERFRQPIRDAITDITDDQILGEPEGRDTLNAIGLTAAILAHRDADAIFAVLTADHLIEPAAEFRTTLERGFSLVEEDPNRLVTFAIQPTAPATGYGYVERGDRMNSVDGAYRVVRFVEKPKTTELAQSYLDTGRFGWNSGMFIFSAKHFLALLHRWHAKNAVGLHAIADAWDTPSRNEVLRTVYPTLPKISVDYAILEPASSDPEVEVCTVEMNLSWIDIGSWPSYAESLAEDEQVNRTNASLIALDAKNLIAIADDPTTTIAAIGCENLILVHTRDALLVCARDQAERVKEVVARVDESKR